ncbi:sugar ABC transporter ATP-binding protein [Nibricoccus sp. IMCC34717]|uniref:sugar ABC transporter ATP-binding protein n=1 Tax=Nibricoccus sp. IMCC34717 TaxID=3034021 RepID=UPI00384C9357
MSDAPLVSVESVAKSFSGVTVLRDISFTVSKGRILGLVGENGAGKSTLMNLIGGNLRPDGGRLRLADRDYAPRSPQEAEAAGVAVIHQELNLFANLSVAENLFLRRLPRNRFGLIDRRRLHADATALLTQVGLALAPDTALSQLSPGQRQLVEIAKAIGARARLILLDEPTTSLTRTESERLFALMHRLAGEGVAMIFISHALDDVLAHCDSVVALRDGRKVGEGTKAELSRDALIRWMIGRSLEQLFPTRSGARTAEVLLDVRDLSGPPHLRDVSVQLHRGEILGLSGLMGAGRTELARLLFGLSRSQEGSVSLDTETFGDAPPRRRIAAGLGFLTENRQAEGLCLDASIAENLTLVTLAQHATGGIGWLSGARLNASCERMRDAVSLDTKAVLSLPVRSLSGGNQQKVVLGKWLLAKPRLLIVDEPTRGIDVGAKFEIYRLLQSLADAGTGILMISSEIEELIGMCDRILVMAEGRLTDTLERADFSRERILRSSLPKGGAA